VIDFQNPRRVQRALEIALQTGQPAAALRRAWATRETPGFRGLLLVREKPDLDARIAANVAAMFARGVVDEVRALGPIGPTAARTLGLREIQALLRGEITAEACRDAIVRATCRYAKRQLTWFRNQFSFPVIDLTGPRHSQALSAALKILGDP
jgi:tRNA dimethylallyltransferase